MADSAHYVIRGGIEGRERLRVLARVMQASTSSLLDRIGLRNGMTCLDIGCGGGDVTLEIARRVVPQGLATPSEIDDIVRELYDFAAAPDTLAGMPRVVQVWAKR